MAIRISQYQTRPAIDIDRVQIVEFRLIPTEEDNSRGDLRIVYKLYGVAGGKKFFEKEQRVAKIDDAYREAVTRAQAGDTRMRDALQAIERAVGMLIQEAGGVGTVTVT